MVDFLGQELNRGDVIVYAVVQSNMIQISTALIVDFTRTKVRDARGEVDSLVVHGFRDGKLYKTKITEIHRVIKLVEQQYNEQCKFLKERISY